MAPRPPSWRQSLLEFPSDTDDPPVSQAVADAHAEESQHALQDDRSPPAGAASGDRQPAAQREDPAAIARALFERVEDQPQGLEEAARRSEAAERSEPARQ